ncbi:MAG: basic secretory family protein [Candidatus Eremiobacteraeota bacterium]|nr:basic secretory family protein [Candidatus Eremiobacteraeota bacterium]
MNTLKKLMIILVSAFIALAFVVAEVNADDIPTIINKHEDAMKVFKKAKESLRSKLGMVFHRPFEIKLVTGKEMDKITKASPYHKNIIGLHRYRKGVNYIYMLDDVGKDRFYGTMCHEMTHGWQDENCPGQTRILREGLARWVEVKALQWSGAHTLARQIHRTADPIYGVGYKFILKVEDKYGEKGVLPYVLKLKDINRNF